MSRSGLEAQMDAVAEQAKEHYIQERPRIAGGWYVVVSAGYDVAVGVQRRGFRVLEWAPPNNPTPLAGVVGSPPIGAGNTRMQTWINKTLAPAAGQPAEVERRLWIVMAWTNAWIKG